jgi:hypothetical protein
VGQRLSLRAAAVRLHRGALGAGRCHMSHVICQHVIVIELHKICLFIYIPYCHYAKDQIWTFNLVYIYGIRGLVFLLIKCLSFLAYALSYSMWHMTYTYTPLIYTSRSQPGWSEMDEITKKCGERPGFAKVYPHNITRPRP